MYEYFCNLNMRLKIEIEDNGLIRVKKRIINGNSGIFLRKYIAGCNKI